MPALSRALPPKRRSAARSMPRAPKRILSGPAARPFAVTDFTADIAPGYMLPASALNALRREALSELLDARGAAKPWPRSDAPAPAAPEKRDRSRTGALWARFAELSQIPAGESFDKILLPVERITPEIIETFGERLIGVLPAILWPADEEALEARLAALKEARAARGVRRQHLRHSAHTPPGTHAARRRGAQHPQHRGAAPL